MDAYQSINWQTYLAYTRKLQKLGKNVWCPELPEFYTDSGGARSMVMQFESNNRNMLLKLEGIQCWQSKQVALSAANSALYRGIVFSLVSQLSTSREPNHNELNALREFVNSSSINPVDKASLAACLHRIFPNKGTFNDGNVLYRRIDPSLMLVLRRLVVSARGIHVGEHVEPEASLIYNLQEVLVGKWENVLVREMPNHSTIVLLRCTTRKAFTSLTLCVCTVGNIYVAK